MGGAGSVSQFIYSIQRTYALKVAHRADAEVLTCEQRIDIPVIEPLQQMQPVVYQEQPRTFVPCIELTGIDLSTLDLTFETNEGVTVLPIMIPSGAASPLGNPYLPYRYVLVLPRGTTGIKSCKLATKAHVPTRRALQHSLTFGVMPPPYNYDNALFGYITYRVGENSDRIVKLENKKTYYGYVRNNGSHTVDFSATGDAFIIKPDTKFIVFFATNGSSNNTNLDILLTAVRDENIHTKSTLILGPGRSTVKIDLQSLEMYVMSSDNVAKTVYNISGVQDEYYSGIKFSYNRNGILTGNVEVHEWA